MTHSVEPIRTLVPTPPHHETGNRSLIIFPPISRVVIADFANDEFAPEATQDLAYSLRGHVLAEEEKRTEIGFSNLSPTITAEDLFLHSARILAKHNIPVQRPEKLPEHLEGLTAADIQKFVEHARSLQAGRL